MNEIVKVKMFEVVAGHYDQWEEAEVSAVAYGVTKWEEVDEETYQMLYEWVLKKNNKYNRSRGKDAHKQLILIVEPKEVNFPACIKEYKEMCMKEKEVEEKKKKTAEKRKKTIEENKRKRRKELFNKLKKEFE